MAEERRAYSRPEFNRTIKIKSEQAQRVYEREFTRVVSSLYAIDVILRIIGDDDEVDQVEQAVGKMIGDCAVEAEAAKIRYDKLRDDNGITDLPDYSNPREVVIRIVSPQVSQFVAVLQKMDELMISLDALWLCGVVGNKARSDGLYQWQQRLLRLGRRIVSIERRARISAKKRGKEVEVLEATGEVAENPESAPADTESVLEGEVAAEIPDDPPTAEAA